MCCLDGFDLFVDLDAKLANDTGPLHGFLEPGVAHEGVECVE